MQVQSVGIQKELDQIRSFFYKPNLKALFRGRIVTGEEMAVIREELAKRVKRELFYTKY